MGLHNLVKDYDPVHVGAIWDAAHSALEGMEPEPALEEEEEVVVASGCDPEFTVRANLDRKGRDAKVKVVSSQLKEPERRRKRKPCQLKPMIDMNAGSPRYRTN
jgi:hypothetical protein